MRIDFSLQLLRADDSNGFIGRLAEDLLRAHARCCDAGVADQKKLAAWIRGKLLAPGATNGNGNASAGAGTPSAPEPTPTTLEPLTDLEAEAALRATLASLTEEGDV